MSKVVRIFPEAKTGLINWIENNFQEIESFVVTFTLKDSTTMTVYHANNIVEAMGIAGVTQSTLVNIANNDEFVPKER